MIVYQKCIEPAADGSSVLSGSRLSYDASDQYVVDIYSIGGGAGGHRAALYHRCSSTVEHEGGRKSSLRVVPGSIPGAGAIIVYPDVV